MLTNTRNMARWDDGQAVVPRPLTQSELQGRRAKQAQRATEAIAKEQMVAFWTLRYEQKVGRSWVKVESNYLVYEQAVRNADMQANLGPTYRNVTLKANHMFTHAD